MAILASTMAESIISGESLEKQQAKGFASSHHVRIVVSGNHEHLN
jgi:hypothetical protein